MYVDKRVIITTTLKINCMLFAFSELEYEGKNLRRLIQVRNLSLSSDGNSAINMSI
jgi:hypothetical protein